LCTKSRHEIAVQEAQERRRKVADSFYRMTESLNQLLHGNTNKETLLTLAQRIALSKNLVVDRASKRSKDGLICWFCEFAPELIVDSPPGSIELDAPTRVWKDTAEPVLDFEQSNEDERNEIDS
jgi:hypothetical protein